MEGKAGDEMSISSKPNLESSSSVGNESLGLENPAAVLSIHGGQSDYGQFLFSDAEFALIGLVLSRKAFLSHTS